MGLFIWWHRNILFFSNFLTILGILFDWLVVIGTEHQTDIFTELGTTVPGTWARDGFTVTM